MYDFGRWVTFRLRMMPDCVSADAWQLFRLIPETRPRSFARKAEAQAHVAKVTGDLATGAYVDSKRSAVTFDVVAEEWFTAEARAR